MHNDLINAALADIQRAASVANGGGKFDVHYRAGKGALVVPGGAELTPNNVVLAVPESHVMILAATGGVA